MLHRDIQAEIVPIDEDLCVCCPAADHANILKKIPADLGADNGRIVMLPVQVQFFDVKKFPTGEKMIEINLE